MIRHLGAGRSAVDGVEQPQSPSWRLKRMGPRSDISTRSEPLLRSYDIFYGAIRSVEKVVGAVMSKRRPPVASSPVEKAESCNEKLLPTATARACRPRPAAERSLEPAAQEAGGVCTFGTGSDNHLSSKRPSTAQGLLQSRSSVVAEQQNQPTRDLPRVDTRSHRRSLSSRRRPSTANGVHSGRSYSTPIAGLEMDQIQQTDSFQRRDDRSAVGNKLMHRKRPSTSDGNRVPLDHPKAILSLWSKKQMENNFEVHDSSSRDMLKRTGSLRARPLSDKERALNVMRARKMAQVMISSVVRF
jgi:hypothetical protein